jgi:hypothetical protein
MKGEFSEQMLEKCSNVKFHGSHSSGSRVVPRGHCLESPFTVLQMHLRSIIIHNFMSNLGVDVSMPNHPGETFCMLILRTV